MDLQKEREAFDRWYGEKPKGWIEGVKYNTAWKAWQAAKAQTVPKWFVVKEIKPVEKDPGEKVLTWDKVNGMRLVPVWSFKTVTDVTHWMPLPDAPQELAND